MYGHKNMNIKQLKELDTSLRWHDGVSTTARM